jgi:hypothetical protein
MTVDVEVIIEIFRQIFQAFRLLGDAVVTGILLILNYFNITVPEGVIELATTVFLILMTVRFGKTFGKVLLIVLILISGSFLVRMFL